MLQSKIFEKILERHPNQATALQQVSELLFLNKSNVYRRYTGEIMLKPDEIEILSKHYQLSIDELIHSGKDEQYLFTHSGSSTRFQEQNLTNYFQDLRNLLLTFNRAPDFKSHYVGYEVINYHHGILCPEVIYFKSMQWKRLLWKTESSFFIDLKELDDKSRQLIKETCSAYNELYIPEIWDNSGLDILLGQLSYTYKLRQISYDDTIWLLNGILESIDELEQKARIGSKKLDSQQKNFELYYSEVPLDTWMFVAFSKSTPALNHISTVLDAPNTIYTSNLELNNRMYARFLRIRNQAQKISETGELTRRKLFNRYRRKIRQLEKQLKQS